MRLRYSGPVLVTPRIFLGLLAMTACVAMAASGASARPALISHACGPHGEDPLVYNVRHISDRAACAVGEKLLKSTINRHLVRCPKSGIGVGTLLVHRFDGYRLSIKDSLLQMTRGRVSFQFASYSDAPVGCD